MDAVANLPDRLRVALTRAMKTRNTTAIAALRSALAAIDNAQAIDVSHTTTRTGSRIAGAVVGLGAGEAPRRDLTDAEINNIVQKEVTERQSAAEQYERLGRHEHAAALHAEANVLRSQLNDA